MCLQDVYTTCETNVLICCVFSHFLVTHEITDHKKSKKKTHYKDKMETEKVVTKVIPHIVSLLIDFIVDALEGRVCIFIHYQSLKYTCFTYNQTT